MQGKVEIEVLTKIEQLEILRPIWEKLSKNPETDLDFFICVIAERPEFIGPRIFLARRDYEPIALLVGRLEKIAVQPKIGYAKLPGLEIKQIVIACHGSKELAPPIAKAFLAAIKKCIKADSADLAKLSYLFHGSVFYEIARNQPNPLLRDYAHKITHRWRLASPGSIEAYYKQFDHKKRNKLKSYIKKFENEFEQQISYRIFTGISEIQQFLDDAEKIASQTYHRQLGVGLLNNAETFRKIAIYANKGWLRAHILYIQDTPIAFWQGILSKGTFYYQTTGYVPEFRKYQIGTILLQKDIEILIERQIQYIDFGLGTAQYKETFCNEYLPEAEVNLAAPTLKGVYANIALSAGYYLNFAICSMLKKIGLHDKIKTKWRRRKEQMGLATK